MSDPPKYRQPKDITKEWSDNLLKSHRAVGDFLGMCLFVLAVAFLTLVAYFSYKEMGL